MLTAVKVGAMKNTDLQKLLDIIHDPAFAELNRRLHIDIFTWEQFKDLPMPAHCTALETWTLFTALRRQTGHVTPLVSWYMPENDLPVWISLNSLIAVELEKIIAACDQWEERHASVIDGVLHYRHTRRIAKDLETALLRDGVALSSDRICRLALGEDVPSSAEEHLAANALSLLAESQRFSSRRLTQWTIEDLVGSLSEGCEESEKGFPEDRVFDFPPSLPTPDDVARMVCGILNTCGKAEKRDFLIDLICFSGTIRDLKPFARWNGVMEFLLRHAYLQQAGLGLLCEVPFSTLMLQWEQGALDERYQVTQGFDDVNPYVGEDADGTALVGFSLRIYATALRDVAEENAEDAARIEVPQQGLNARQAHLLGLLAVRGEDITFARYGKLYNVSRGTARNDLHALEEMGYVQSFYRSRSLVFRAVEDEGNMAALTV